MKKILLGFLVFFSISVSFADQGIISLFPLDNYDQNISTWIKLNSPDIDKPLLSSEAQQKRFEDFMDHYIGNNSPWNATYINKLYRQENPNDLKSIEQSIIDYFSNTGKSGNDIGYGENFRPYTNKWINDISNNINMSQFDNLTYQSSHRAITINNLYARALPTNDPHFYSYQVAGQGYPFNNLQMSAVWMGTPVYVITETEDHEWSYIITPDFVAWVKSNGIAMVDNAFVTTWTQAAKNKLAAITKTKTSLVDMKNKHIANAYVGSIFPANDHSNNLQLMVPAADDNHNAIIKYTFISTESAAVMPIVITQRNFSKLFGTLINRPYGWGSLYFYNDCSAELKSLFTPFAIW